MSLARREDILARLFAVLASITELTTTARNRGMIKNDIMPVGILMDGDEDAVTNGVNRGRQRMSPALVVMHPQIYIILPIGKPTNVSVGQELNAFRGRLIRAIVSDQQLLTLIGPNGDIGYEGCETDLKSGMPMEGQMLIKLFVKTVMNPYAN